MASLAVTVSGKASAALIAHAEDRARTWGLPFAERARKTPLQPLLDAYDALLVFGEDGVVLQDKEGKVGFHAGLAHLRVKCIQRGERNDALVKVAGIAPGESVLDCTLGLGQDAWVAAHLVGAKGRVVGVEKSLPLYAVVSEGVARQEVEDAATIEPVLGDHAEFLRAQKSGSFDCVLFDPMFERPRKSQPGFETLRRHADYAPLTKEVLGEALRVARRCVAVKASPHSQDLKKLGLKAADGRRDPRVQWARIEKGDRLL